MQRQCNENPAKILKNCLKGIFGIRRGFRHGSPIVGISSMPWSVEKTPLKNTPSQAGQHQHLRQQKHQHLHHHLRHHMAQPGRQRSLFGPVKPRSSSRPWHQNPGMRAGRQRMAASAATAKRRGAARSPKGEHGERP
jgi:hypothetical protein